MPSPEPPYSVGTDMPSTPISASLFMFSAGHVPSRYLMARGANSFWHVLRTTLTNSRCSSLNLKSMFAVLFCLRLCGCARGVPRYDALGHFLERSEHLHACAFERCLLGRVAAVTAMHERAGVPHRDAFRRTAAGDQCEYRFAKSMRCQRSREFLFLAAADLAD